MYKCTLNIIKILKIRQIVHQFAYHAAALLALLFLFSNITHGMEFVKVCTEIVMLDDTATTETADSLLKEDEKNEIHIYLKSFQSYEYLKGDLTIVNSTMNASSDTRINLLIGGKIMPGDVFLSKRSGAIIDAIDYKIEVVGMKYVENEYILHLVLHIINPNKIIKKESSTRSRKLRLFKKSP